MNKFSLIIQESMCCQNIFVTKLDTIFVGQKRRTNSSWEVDGNVSFYCNKVGLSIITNFFSGDVWARVGQQVAHESLVKRRLFSDDCSDHSQIILRWSPHNPTVHKIMSDPPFINRVVKLSHCCSRFKKRHHGLSSIVIHCYLLLSKTKMTKCTMG